MYWQQACWHEIEMCVFSKQWSFFSPLDWGHWLSLLHSLDPHFALLFWFLFCQWWCSERIQERCQTLVQRFGLPLHNPATKTQCQGHARWSMMYLILCAIILLLFQTLSWMHETSRQPAISVYWKSAMHSYAWCNTYTIMATLQCWHLKQLIRGQLQYTEGIIILI